MGLKSYCPADQTCSTWALSYFGDCICSEKDLISFFLGIASIVCWAVAEVPQILESWRSTNAEGVSLALILTWMAGDICNLLGCLISPATLPTQLYLAALYCATTLLLVVQHLRFAWISYRQSARLASADPLARGQRRGQLRRPIDMEPSPGTLEHAPYSKSLPAKKSSQEINLSREANSLPAIPLLRDANPHSQSVPAFMLNRRSPTGFSDSWSRLTNSYHGANGPTPRGLIFSAVSVVGVTGCFIYFGAAHSAKEHGGVSWSGSEGYQLFQDLEGKKRTHTLGLVLGWFMTCIYLTGRLPQCMLNCSHDFVIGVSVPTMVFAFVGNGTYLSSILVRSLKWKRLKPVLPWVFDMACCLLMDLAMVTQYLIRRQQGNEYEYLA